MLALVGDVALDEGRPAVHAHAVVGRSDGAARGGHLLAGHVRPTLEVVLSESPAHLRKRYDPSSGLALIALDLLETPPELPQGETNMPGVSDGGPAQRPVGEEAETPHAATEEGAGLEPD